MKKIFYAAMLAAAFAANKAVAQNAPARAWKQESPHVKTVTGLPSGQAISLKDSAGCKTLVLEAWDVMGIEGETLTFTPYDSSIVTTYRLYDINGLALQYDYTSLMARTRGDTARVPFRYSNAHIQSIANTVFTGQKSASSEGHIPMTKKTGAPYYTPYDYIHCAATRIDARRSASPPYPL